uniref:VWFA domain-containing protein n=1 Tax=Palpitomonas bilix TaxID=652834 RepID=A0A7S3DGH3_9EUKA
MKASSSKMPWFDLSEIPKLKHVTDEVIVACNEYQKFDVMPKKPQPPNERLTGVSVKKLPCILQLLDGSTVKVNKEGKMDVKSKARPPALKEKKPKSSHTRLHQEEIMEVTKQKKSLPMVVTFLVDGSSSMRALSGGKTRIEHVSDALAAISRENVLLPEDIVRVCLFKGDGSDPKKTLDYVWRGEASKMRAHALGLPDKIGGGTPMRDAILDVFRRQEAFIRKQEKIGDSIVPNQRFHVFCLTDGEDQHSLTDVAPFRREMNEIMERHKGKFHLNVVGAELDEEGDRNLHKLIVGMKQSQHSRLSTSGQILGKAVRDMFEKESRKVRHFQVIEVRRVFVVEKDENGNVVKKYEKH